MRLSFSMADYLQFLRIIPLLYFAAWVANPFQDPLLPIGAFHTLVTVAPRIVWAAIPAIVAIGHLVTVFFHLTRARYAILTLSLVWWLFLSFVVGLGGELWRLTGSFCLANATQAAFMYVVITRAISRGNGA